VRRRGWRRGWRRAVVVDVDSGMRCIVCGHRAANVCELGWALHAAELDVRIVGLAAGSKPTVPIVAPFAPCLQCFWQAAAATLRVATAIVVVTVKVAGLVPRELLLATLIEDPLPGSRNLKIEAMIPSNVIPDIGDLNHHRFASQIGMGTAPIIAIRVVLLVRETELVALAAVLVAIQTIDATDSSGRKTHAQAAVYEERLVVCTTRGSATVAN